MPKQFFISLKAMIRDDNGAVLFLVKNKNNKKYLDLPGGRMEGMDSFEDSLIRELEEELSIEFRVNVIKQVGETWELPIEFIKDNNRQLVITFLVEADLETLKLSEEHLEVKWISKEMLENLDEEYVLIDGFRQNLVRLFS